MTGYNEKFLDGIRLPLPAFSPRLGGFVLRQPELENGVYANYVNYTVVMNRPRRAPIFAALNIDQNKIQTVSSRDSWRFDSRIGPEFQLNNDYYFDNPWDRGHLARRASAAWGRDEREAQRASDETFYYSNASLQHRNFNRDEWLALEDWVLQLKLDKDGKLTSFSGPIYGDFSRTITPEGREPAMIPSAFFKIVCFINKNTHNLDVRAFIMVQDRDALADRSGRSLFDFQNYQVTVSEIEEFTGLEFDNEIYERNPLLFRENPGERTRLNISHFPERIEVDSSEEIVDANRPRDFFADDDINVYITAAMVNPRGNERENEWISVINLSDQDVDLDGWTLTDTKRAPLDIGTAVDARGRVLSPGEAVAIKPISPLMLANTGGVIALHAKPEPGEARGKRVDRVKYSEDGARRAGVPVIFATRLPPSPI